MKSNRLNFVAMLGLAASVAILPACNKKEGCTDPTASNYDANADKDNGSCTYDDAVKSGTLSADETWDNSRIYFISGRVVVPSGVTLTIEAGAIIKGNEGTDANASALIVAKGGKIIANGTASSPIIFTSALDNIKLGEKVGTNLTKTDNEKWGGLIILGSAPVSTESGDTEGNIEGIPANLSYGVYGGTNATDNSGSLQYVSIRHGGTLIGEGNEINGLTLGGVGSGTTISNIEIYATLDDGIECFGGTVNLSNILVFYQGDDGLDIDQNYAGTIDGFAVIQGDGVGTDEGLEVDGPEGTTNVTGLCHFMNGLCTRQGSEGTPGDFKSKAQGSVTNVTFDYPGAIKIRASYQNGCVDPKSDAFTYLTNTSPTLTFVNSSFAAVSVYTASNDGATPPVTCTVSGADQTAAEAVMTSGSGGSVVPTTLFSWTAAGLRSEL